MYALPDVEEVRSISKTGLSGITVVFKEGTDIYFARQLVFERLQTAMSLIPEGVGTPNIGPNTSGLGQIYQYLLKTSPNADITTTELRSLNDWVVKLLLMPVDGVTDVLSFGGEVKQYQVNINPNDLLAYKLTQDDVVAALEANNANAGGWYMNRGQEQLSIRGMGWFASGEQGIADIKKVALKTIDGSVITVSDVAEVNTGGEIRQGAVTMTQRDDNLEAQALGEVVTGIVLKRMGANTKATIDGITERSELINQAMPEGVTFETIYDQADLITKAVSTVVNALFLAFIFIIVVLALFLMNLRATLLVLMSIPIAIGLTLMVMSIFGMSANLMSLGGLAVAIGMLVDGSVVMVENIFKRLDENGDAVRPLANELVIKRAGFEVARSIFFAAAIILVVFLPIFSFEGVEAKLFQPMAISIMLAIVASVIVALIIVPAMSAILFKNGVRAKESFVLKPLNSLYQKSLTLALGKSKIIIIAAAALFALTLLLLPRIGTEFVPELEEGTINLRVTLAPSSSLETALEVAPKLENMLLDFPEVNYALSRIGRPELGGDPEPVNNIEIYIGLKPASEWTSAKNRLELQSKMEEKLSSYPGLLFNFSQPISTRVDELLSGVKAQLAIKLFGPDLNELVSTGQAIEAAVKEVSGTKDVAIEQIAGEAQLVIKPKREALSRFGMSVGDVMQLVSSGLGGTEAGQVINGNERYAIYVRLGEQYRNNISSIKNLPMIASSGALIKLSDIATVKIDTAPPQIRRDDVQRRVVIQANVQGRDMGSVVSDIQQAINDDVSLPTGYSVSIGGQFENQQRAAKRLSLVVPVSLVLIALLLFFMFNSVRQAALIMINVPLAIIGGIIALFISNQYLSVPSAVGFITLFGVAVLNGVVMVESINQQLAGLKEASGHALLTAKETSLQLQTAVFEGATSRLRPVLMTAFTSALGLIPMLLSTGVGSEIQKPLATVIVGGLLSSTILTLFILPALYPYFSSSKVASNKNHFK